MLNDEQRGKNVGRFNFRAGRFYVPFGLNLQTDTHGTVLQLSNERNFGFERDWYTGFWGTINKHLNYDAYYLAGSGYDLKYKGQSGLGARARKPRRIKYSSEYGLEGGVSMLGGERLALAPNEQLSSDRWSSRGHPIRTERAGVDGRYRHGRPERTFDTYQRSEAAAAMPLLRLHSTAPSGVSPLVPPLGMLPRSIGDFTQDGAGTDSSMIGEVSWYFRNDVGNSNSHWIKLNVERQLERMHGPPGTRS